MNLLRTMSMSLLLLTATGLACAQGKSTGYPKCDEYISMVSACINTKMPESERADHRQQLQSFRDLLSNSMLGPSVASACEQNIKIEMQRDRYGCYAGKAATSGVKTACSLVSAGEISKILGTAFNAGIPGNSKCMFDSPAAPTRPLRIEVHWEDGADEMKAWRAGTAQVARELKKVSKTPAVASETLTGVADDAFFVQAGLMPMLAVRKGDVALSVEGPWTQEQLITIAKTALGRL